ncbi:TPA: hypothetical protein N0F65_004320 [Lagenidium giganteum]|uniref:Symplekin n=1 Tax=Lagenidium giganteum TaxID=4803 RepID=A0AAV2ZGL4_9STRA|nr:TPA: hypothetical protein N0F65_004320 [Lagenidium giganteum]
MATEAQVTQLLQELPLAGDNAAQVAALQRVQELVFHRDASGDEHRLLYAAMAHVPSLHHVQNAPLTALLLQFLSQANRAARNAFLRETYDLTGAVLALGFSSEKNVLTACQHVTLSLPVALGELIDTKPNPRDIERARAVWSSLQQNLEQLVDVVSSGPVALGSAGSDGQNNNRSALVWLRAWRCLERAVLLLSVARDRVYRDPARSNVQPDEMTLDRLSGDHAVLDKSQLEALGATLVQRLCARLSNDRRRGGDDGLGRRDLCVAVNSLALLTALRPQFMGHILPCLVGLQPSDHTVQATIKSNLIKLLAHPAAQTHADEVTECLIAYGASERAFRAISSSKVPRRKYVSAPSEASLRRARLPRRVERGDGEPPSRRMRTGAGPPAPASSVAVPATNVPREAITHERLVNLPSTDVVNIVLESFTCELPTPPPPNVKLQLPPSELKARMVTLLATLATPSSALAIETSARRHRDPRRRRDPRLSQQEQPPLVQVFDDTALDEVSDWISKNASLVAEPVVSLAEDNSVQVHLKPVTAGWCREMAVAAVIRILENEHGVSIRGDERLREQLLCRLAASPWLLYTDDRNKKIDPAKESQLPPMYKAIMDFVLEDYAERATVARTLFYHEYVRFIKPIFDESGNSEETEPVQRSDVVYKRLVNYCLTGMLKKMDVSTTADKKLFGAVVASLPCITADILEVIAGLFENAGGGVVLGITILRDLIKERHACRSAALKMLLRYTCHEEESCRNSSIRCVANQLYTLDSLKEEIEAYAVMLVQSLKDEARDVSMSDDEEEDEELGPTHTDDAAEANTTTEGSAAPKTLLIWRKKLEEMKATDKKNERELLAYTKVLQDQADLNKSLEGEVETLRRLELLLALCAKKPALLNHLVTTYAHASETVRQVIFLAIEKLIKHLKQRGGVDVVAQLHGFEANSLGFVCHVIQILSSGTRPSDELVRQTMALYQAHEHIPDSISVLIPVLPGVSSDVLFPLFPVLLSLPQSKLSVALTKLLEAMPPQLVSASDLLIALHHIDLKADATMQKKVINAINLCVEHRHIFPGEVLVQVCRQLIREERIPKLTLRTLILSVTTYPAFQEETNALLGELADRHVWTMEDALWKGFVKCVALIQPVSFPLLLEKLPIEQVQAVVGDEPDLLPLLTEFVVSEEGLAVSPEIRQLLDKAPGAMAVDGASEVVAVKEEPAVKEEQHVYVKAEGG